MEEKTRGWKATNPWPSFSRTWYTSLGLPAMRAGQAHRRRSLRLSNTNCSPFAALCARRSVASSEVYNAASSTSTDSLYATRLRNFRQLSRFAGISPSPACRGHHLHYIPVFLSFTSFSTLVVSLITHGASSASQRNATL
jgi:hypothetical protein